MLGFSYTAIFAVALGGALGAVSRFLLSHQIYVWLGRDFAWGTLGVNVIGSFFMGLLTILLVDKWMVTVEWRMLFLVGFLGAFTTFSTFSYETLQYIELGAFFKAIANMAVSLLLTVFAVWLGLSAGRMWLSQ